MRRPSKEFCSELAGDPLVVRWFAAISDNKGTQAAYLSYLAMFCVSTRWSPREIIETKREAMMRGEPIGKVEDALRDFYFALNTGSYPQTKTSRKRYAPKTSSLAVTACCSFLRAHGFPVPRKFIRMSQATEKEIRRLEREEVESVILHAGSSDSTRRLLRPSSMTSLSLTGKISRRTKPALRMGKYIFSALSLSTLFSSSSESGMSVHLTRTLVRIRSFRYS